MKLFRNIMLFFTAILMSSCNFMELSEHEIKFSSSGGVKSFTASADVNFIGIKNTDTKAFIIINDAEDWNKYPFTLDGAWFKIHRSDASTFSIECEPNNSGAVRSFLIYLENDEYYDHVTVYQKK